MSTRKNESKRRYTRERPKHNEHIKKEDDNKRGIHGKAGTSHRSVAQRFPYRLAPLSSFPRDVLQRKWPHLHKKTRVSLYKKCGAKPSPLPLSKAPPPTARNKVKVFGNPRRSTPTHRSVLALTLSFLFPSDQTKQDATTNTRTHACIQTTPRWVFQNRRGKTCAGSVRKSLRIPPPWGPGSSPGSPCAPGTAPTGRRWASRARGRGTRRSWPGRSRRP